MADGSGTDTARPVPRGDPPDRTPPRPPDEAVTGRGRPPKRVGLWSPRTGTRSHPGRTEDPRPPDPRSWGHPLPDDVLSRLPSVQTPQVSSPSDLWSPPANSPRRCNFHVPKVTAPVESQEGICPRVYVGEPLSCHLSHRYGRNDKDVTKYVFVLTKKVPRVHKTEKVPLRIPSAPCQ